MKFLGRTAALLLASPALANTWIVDAAGGPGSHFTDIPPAISTAVDGDVILVRPGSYSAFTLNEPLVIVAQGPGVTVGGGSAGSKSKIENIVTGSKAALAGVKIQGELLVKGCSTEVILDELVLPYGQLTVQGCQDVRLRGCAVTGKWGYSGGPGLGSGDPGYTALAVFASRVEVVDCSLKGGRGGDCFQCDAGESGGWGGAGIEVLKLSTNANTSEVHVVRSSLTGGDGGDASAGGFGGTVYVGGGGDAMRVGNFPYNASTAQISGQPAQVFKGGAGGKYYGNGPGGHGLRIYSQAAARTSGVTFMAGPNQYPAIHVDPGATHEPAVPDDPTLRIVAAPVAGQVTTFRTNAPPGSFVTLLLGRNGKVTPLPGLGEDLLIVPSRAIPLGTVGGTGVISFNQPIPAALGSGFVLHAQCEVQLSGSGEVRYTNSTPLVLR